MLASQMIYTACGKDRSGSFSVWAKSTNVSKNECDEIIKLMSYKRPPNAPYEPTEEEINDLFPKKYGYFELSTGRKCFVQTSYVGKVYSDLDKRNGNFIIHAYIFDNLDTFNPFEIFSLNIFKTKLSYEEWHENDAPDNLPVVELESKPYIDEKTVKELLLGSSNKEVVSLLQALINSTYTEQKVTFNDTEENQLKLYGLIGLLLPASYYSKLTYLNQYSTQFDYSFGEQNVKPIKVRNIFSSMINTAFNYQEELNNGSYVFNFIQGIYTDLAPKRYLSDIIKSLQNDSLDAINKKIKEVDSIIVDSSCDVDTAIAVYYIKQGKLNWFDTPQELKKALDIALQYHLVDENEITQNIYDEIIVKCKYGKGSSILTFIKFVYEHNEKLKLLIMENYFMNLADYGVNTNSSPLEIINNIKEKAPFNWDDFANSIVQNKEWQNLLDNNNLNKNYLYALFDASLLQITKSVLDDEKMICFKLIVIIIKKAFFAKDFNDIQYYFNNVSKLGEKASNWVLEKTLSEYLNKPINDKSMLDLMFRIICSYSYEKEQIKILEMIVSANIQTNVFMNIYIQYSEEAKNKNLFSTIENNLKSNTIFNDFIDKKNLYLFEQTPNISYKELNNYFEKYYKNGNDNGLYLKKIQQYFIDKKAKEKIVDGLDIYKTIRTLPDNFQDVISIMKYIDKVIFDLPITELIELLDNHMVTITELNDKLISNKIAIPENYAMLTTYYLITGTLDEKLCREQLQSNTLYDSLNKNQIIVFVNSYSSQILNLYLKYKKNKLLPTDMLIVGIFEKPIMHAVKTKEAIIKGLEKLNSKNYYEIMADLMAYAFNENNKFANETISFLEYYIGIMKRSSYKKLFNKIVELIPNDQKKNVNTFIDKYLNEHMSFFEKIFNRKNNR